RPAPILPPLIHRWVAGYGRAPAMHVFAVKGVTFMNSLDASGARKLARRRLDLSRQLKRSVLGLCVAASLCLTSPALGQSTRTAPRTAPQPAKPAQALAANAPTASQLKVMAVVNGEQISRQELAQEC